MNLYYKPDRTTVPATIALYVLFGLVVLLGLSKLLIYDVWYQNARLQEEYDKTMSQLAAYEEQLADYEDTVLEYTLYAPTDEEAAQVDRLEILNLVDSVIRPIAGIDSISIKGSQALLHFSGVTLSQTAEIVLKLEASPMVAGTMLDTASSTDSDKDVVTASLLITLQKEKE